MGDPILKNGQQVLKAPDIGLCTVTYVRRMERLSLQVHVCTHMYKTHTTQDVKGGYTCVALLQQDKWL